ncbi:unnamed protein product [Musa acuminata subsp. burmannicoides]
MIRRRSRVVDCAQYESLRWSGKGRRHGEPAQGHFPVYVGEEMERFEVRTELLGRPAFVRLLRLSADEYGYEQRGNLTMQSAAVMDFVMAISLPLLLFSMLLGFSCYYLGRLKGRQDARARVGLQQKDDRSSNHKNKPLEPRHSQNTSFWLQTTFSSSTASDLGDLVALTRSCYPLYSYIMGELRAVSDGFCCLFADLWNL